MTAKDKFLAEKIALPCSPAVLTSHIKKARTIQHIIAHRHTFWDLVRGPFGVRSGFVRGSFGICSGSDRDPFGVRSGSDWDPFGIHSGSGQDPFGVRSECSGCVRGPFGIRWGFVRSPFGIRSGSVRVRSESVYFDVVDVEDSR